MAIEKVMISIDVGVKNLALCVLAKDKSGTITIIHWDLFDVVKESQKPDNTVNDDGFEIVTLKKRKQKDKTNVEYGVCQSIVQKTKKVCGKKGIINNRGKAYCGVHRKQQNKKPQDTQDWVYAMISCLPQISEKIDGILQQQGISNECVEIIIEQQSMINKKILMQSHIIYAHFVQFYKNTVPIRYVPAYNKLLAYNGPAVDCTLKTPYAQRKYLAIKYTEHFLNNFAHLEHWKVFFEKCKKKQDDISDAFLQGMYVLQGPIKSSKLNVIVDKSKPRKTRTRKIRF